MYNKVFTMTKANKRHYFISAAAIALILMSIAGIAIQGADKPARAGMGEPDKAAKADMRKKVQAYIAQSDLTAVDIIERGSRLHIPDPSQ